MLSSRKDAGTGNKLVLYWHDGSRRIIVPADKHEIYWDKEVKRLKAAANYEEAQAQQKIDELILDVDTLRAMLNLRDCQLKKALNKS